MGNYTNTAVPAPGVFLKDELDERGWSQRDLAYVLGCPEQAVNMIVSGKRGISPEMAKALGKAFDVPPEFFVNLQAAHDLSKATDPDPGVERRALLQKHFPIREMIKRGWLEDTDSEMLSVQVARFFKAEKLDQVPHLRYAAKKTHYDETPSAQLAWLFRVRQIAESIVVPAYSERKLREVVQQLEYLRVAPEETRQVARLLAECGVRFVVVESLPNAKIDGVCLWLNKGSPVIGMSLSRDRIDNFWFVLRHEIEHVLQKHGQTTECLDVELTEDGSGNANEPEEERVANAAAANFCVPVAHMNDFIARVRPFFSEQRVVLFAQRMNIHPGLVVGQIQKRTNNHAFLKRHQVKVRQFVISSATSDGFGQVASVNL